MAKISHSLAVKKRQKPFHAESAKQSQSAQRARQAHSEQRAQRFAGFEMKSDKG